jgi:filamentous hemagglutinin family protein
MENFVEVVIKLFLFLPLSLFALGGEPEVVSGAASYTLTSPHHETIHTSDKTILHYQSFNLEKNHQTTFHQPTSKSTLLCRITGSDPSLIRGSIDANGRLLFINPNGIIFSKTAKIHVGSLIASTLDIKNEDFMNDRFRFTLSPEAQNSLLIHQGEISATENVVFMASHIRHEGIVKANVAAMLGGEVITLDFDGDQKMSFCIEAPLKQGGIEFGGQLAAKEVYVKLETARKMIDLVLQTNGITVANKISIENGVVRLIEDQKTCLTTPKGTLLIEAPEIIQEGALISKGPIHYKADWIKIGGSIATANAPIILDGPVCLIKNDALHFKTSYNDIVFGSTLDADLSSRALTIQNGNGSVYFKGDIGEKGSLGALNVSCKTVFFHGNIGGETPGIAGPLILEKAGVYCHGSIYHTGGEQNWKVGSIHMTHEGIVQMKTDGKDFCFGLDAEILLEKAEGLSIQTRGGMINLAPIKTNKLQSIDIQAGEGDVHLKEVGEKISILEVGGRNILIAGQLEGSEIFLDAEYHLAYQEGSISTFIKSSGPITLNARRGSVGSIENPLQVQTEGNCFVGAKKVAYLEGRCADQIPHDYLKNPPPRKIFNTSEYNSLPMDEIPLDEGPLKTLASALARKRKSTAFMEEAHLFPKHPRIYYEVK